MNILLTGATGFIGHALVPRLLQEGHSISVWTRDVQRARRILPDPVHALEALDEWPEGQALNAVINLAGAPIVDQRWTAARKAVLRRSRIDLTQMLVRWIDRRTLQPEVMLSGSAIGYYGMQCGDERLIESDSAGDDFAARLCDDWERAAQPIAQRGTRLVHLRTGLVLGPGGGVLARMLPAFRLGLGGPIARGRQAFSWIALADYLEAVVFLLNDSKAQGPYNLTAPKAVSQAEFARALGRQLRRPACLPMPAFALRLILGEEAAQLLIMGQCVYPQRLLDAGFVFRYPQLDEALRWAIAEQS